MKLIDNALLKIIERVHNAEGYVNKNIHHYYRKDHLGNNREVWKADGNTIATIQRTQYYPSGLPWSEGEGASEQPYKHNSTEFIEMHGYDVSDHGNRIIHHASNRYTTMDRFAEKFPWQSPYVHAANNPVNFVDVNGDSIWTTINTVVNNADGTTSIQTSRYYYGQDSNGNYGFIGSNGQIYSGDNQFVNVLSTALGNLKDGGNAGNSLVGNLMNSSNNVSIRQGNKNVADMKGTYITWNPNSTTGGMNMLDNENRPSFIGLGHEMAHIQDVWNGTIDNSTWVNVGGVAIPNSEKYATHIENQLRSENNIPLRTHYGIDASTGSRLGLESTRIISGTVSKFYSQPNGVVRDIPLLTTPFKYK